MGANAIGQGINVLIQVLSLPLFLHFWDNSTYGRWLVISAIPSYLSMADAGMLYAAGNKMAMATARADIAAARRIFQSALVFILVISVSFIAIAALLCIYLPFGIIASEISTGLRIPLFLLSCSIVLSLFCGLADSLMRATGRYPLGTLLSNLVRLSEWVGYAGGLLWDASFTSVAAGGFLCRLIGFLILMRTSAAGMHGIKWGLSEFTADEIRSLAKPAFSFMLFPAAFALSFQGVTLVIGAALGTSAVAIFSVYRTIARLSVQVVSILSLAVGPEFSRLSGSGDFSGMTDLYKKSLRASFRISLAVIFLVSVATPLLLHVWTKGRIGFDPELLIILMAYALASCLAHVPRTVLLSINQHSLLAVYTLFISILLLGGSWVFAGIFGLFGVGLSMLISEIALSCISFHLKRRWLVNNTRNII